MKMTDIHSDILCQSSGQYEVHVHSLKSSAKTIGAMNLSEMALGQEMASKDLDVDAINAGYEAMMSEYTSVISILKGVVGAVDSFEETSDDDEILEFFPE